MSKGKWFEKKSIEFLGGLDPSARIWGERRIPTDYDPTEFRKIDISIGNPGDSDFLIFECKNWKKVIGPREIDECLGQMADVRAKKVTLLVNGKVSESAKKKAKKRGVKVFSLIDPSEKDFRSKLLAKVLTHFFWIKMFRYSLWLADSQLEIYGEPKFIVLDDGKTLTQLVQDKWNQELISREPGFHNFFEGFHMIKAPQLGIKMAAVDKIKVEYEVTSAHFLHEVELNKGRGFFNILQKSFRPLDSEIGFGPVSIEEIINKGIRISKQVRPEEFTFEQFAYFAG